MHTFAMKGIETPVSRIALGCMRINQMSVDDVERLVFAALDAGINFFDHADIYGGGVSEELFGSVLARNPGLRDRMLIQSKCDIVTAQAGGQRYDTSRDYIISSVEGSLRRLGTDFLDVLLLHRPDVLCDPAEVAEAFDSLEQRGLVRHFGVSNHNPARIELLRRFVRQPLVANQVQFSLVHNHPVNAGVYCNMAEPEAVDRDGGVLDYCMLNDIAVQAWCPLQASWADGTFIDNPKYAKVNEVLASLAQKYGVTKAALATAWLLRVPSCNQVILGTTSIEHLQEACAANAIALTRQEWYDLYMAATNPLP